MKHSHHYQVAKNLAKLLDSQFSFLGIKFGIDPILGIIPGIGSILPSALSFYIVWIAHSIQIPQRELVRMVFNIVVDFFVGSIPVLGTLADVFIRANEKNMKILEKYMNEKIEYLETKDV